MSIKEFAEKFIQAEDEAFFNDNFVPLKAIEDPNIVYHMGTYGDLIGHEAHKQDILSARKAVSDRKHEWTYLTGEGNLFALSLKASGRYTSEKPGFPTPIGKKFAFDYIFVLRVNNNRIVEAWANGSVAILD